MAEIKWDGSNIDDCASSLEKGILVALESACPKRGAVQRPPNPWWNRELDEIRKELTLLHKKSKDSPAKWESYTNLRRIYANKIRKFKRDSWREFCTKAETAKDISKVVKILKPKPKVGISLFKNQGKTLSPRETLDNLMDMHFIESVVTDEDNEVMPMPVRMSTDESTLEFVEYINVQKVIASLGSFGPYKAAGPDEFKI